MFLDSIIKAGSRQVSGYVNHEGQRIAGQVIHGLAHSAERKLDKEADDLTAKLPKFVRGEARSLAHRGVDKVVGKGEQMAMKEVSKIKIM